MNRVQKKNIIYFCTAEKGASGGAKVLYNHSKVINKLKNDFNSKILHIGKKKSSKWKNSINKFLKIKNKNFYGWEPSQLEIKKVESKWLDKEIKIQKDFKFNAKLDFIIIPEIFAHLADHYLIKKKIPFAIYVMNGYALQSTSDFNLIKKAYRKAKFILSVSNDTTKCINLAFPFCSNKILKQSLSVNAGAIPNNKKKNYITYMERKLPFHSKNVLFFLKNNLSRNWKIKNIHNLTEKKVFEILSISKIFLSFSELEGLGLPPIEAAIAKNRVIGYAGEGGSEYWKKPIFNEIKNGNILKFCETIIKYTKNLNNFKFSEKQRLMLINNYSAKKEKNDIKKNLEKIKSIYY